MTFFPTDPAKYRPSKILFKVEVLHEVDRAVQDGLGGYANRHELVNDIVEQGLIELRYPDDEGPEGPSVRSEVETTGDSTPASNGHGDTAIGEAPREPTTTTIPGVEPLNEIADTRIAAPAMRGVTVENKLARVPNTPMWGMHNRDAPSAWALARLAAEASAEPIALGAFYERTTEEAWKLAAQLASFETGGNQKLAVMLPRNPEKPQSAADGFRAFALGHVARKPEDGRLTAWGPFYQWGAVGIVGDVTRPQIGLTESGWELVRIFDGLDFSLPHDDEITRRFLKHLRQHAAPDLWGFRTVLEGAARGAGRVEMSEYFRARLNNDFLEDEWKESVADSVASGYVSRARAWGLLEPKLHGRVYRLTSAGQEALDEFSATVNAA
jgi:hypothetical protein